MTDLIFVPGLMCDASVWKTQIDDLEGIASARVALPGPRNSLGEMADALLAEAPPTFALVGHSMGGRVALEVMRRAAHRVQGLALLDTGYRAIARGQAGERERAGRFALLEMARAQGMRAMGRRWLEGMIHSDRHTDQDLVERILDMIASQPPELFEAQIQALLGRADATAILINIGCPTLVLCGREDGWSPVSRHKEIAALIDGSRLVIVPDCGHMSTLERPAAISNALRDWLDSVRSAA
ncbi:MAG TPA: alpha/beta hydrolase [Steroidobacteraceae bacterium]|nr:alpha/beta hydrolase [Steroidobacteraceae bacterium]